MSAETTDTSIAIFADITERAVKIAKQSCTEANTHYRAVKRASIDAEDAAATNAGDAGAIAASAARILRHLATKIRYDCAHASHGLSLAAYADLDAKAATNAEAAAEAALNAVRAAGNAIRAAARIAKYASAAETAAIVKPLPRPE